jgi:hypothetical protein
VQNKSQCQTKKLYNYSKNDVLSQHLSNISVGGCYLRGVDAGELWDIISDHPEILMAMAMTCEAISSKLQEVSDMLQHQALNKYR